MGYTADITGFPYWKVGGPYATAVKVERKSWDKVAKDLMKVAEQRTELEKSVGKTEDWLDKEMLKNEKLKEDMKSLKNENKFYLRKMEKMRKKMKELEEESKVDKEFQEEVVQENKAMEEELEKQKKKARDPRITVSHKENSKEYMRQKQYIKNHPDCERVPGRMEVKIHSKGDPRITVRCCVDRTEYQRQLNHIRRHPDCEKVPEKQGRWPEGRSMDPRITVTKEEDVTEYNRQYGYIVRNPDCEVIPPRVRNVRGTDNPDCKRVPEKGKRTGPKGKAECPYEKNDPRITVEWSEDPQEYNRQRLYLRIHPDCEKIPERSKKKHTKG